MRKEVIGDCTLYLGDCLEVMPTLGKVDAVVTDPVWPNVPEDCDIAGKEDPNGLFRNFCYLLNDLSPRQLVVIMRNDSDPRFLSPIPDFLPFQQVAWCQYVMPGYLGSVLGGNETAYVFGQPVKSQEGRRVIPSVSPKAQPSDRPANGHPCSRAQIHSDWIIHWFSDEGETVLDPFMGSATTGISCIKQGRKFIGCEVMPKYFELACRRIEEAYRQPDLFIAPPKKEVEQLTIHGYKES